MSFKIGLLKKDRVASRFLAQIHAEIANAAVEAKKEKGISQIQIANELGIDKATVSRILKGIGNPTARTLGELAAALGYKPEFILRKPNSNMHQNYRSEIVNPGRTTLDERKPLSSAPSAQLVSHQFGR